MRAKSKILLDLFLYDMRAQGIDIKKLTKEDAMKKLKTWLIEYNNEVHSNE